MLSFGIHALREKRVKQMNQTGSLDERRPVSPLSPLKDDFNEFFATYVSC